MVVLPWLVVMVDVDGRGVPLTALASGQHWHLIGLIDGHNAYILVVVYPQICSTDLDVSSCTSVKQAHLQGVPHTGSP